MTLGRAQRVAAMKAASEFVAERISALGVSNFQKIANSLAKEKEPDWSWWENVISPMVVGSALEQVIKDATRIENKNL